jgi:hypothetical protein
MIIRSSRRRIAIAIATPFLTLSLVYLFFLTEERISAWQAARILDRLEMLQLGDPTASFDRAVQGCPMEKTSTSSTCVLHAGAFGFAYPWKLVSKLPDDWTYRLSKLLGRAGLRYWRLVASVSIDDAQVKDISVSGAGTWGPPLRLGSNPEIVMLQFE